jgi:hypothetical protein
MSPKGSVPPARISRMIGVRSEVIVVVDDSVVAAGEVAAASSAPGSEVHPPRLAVSTITASVPLRR